MGSLGRLRRVRGAFREVGENVGIPQQRCDEPGQETAPDEAWEHLDWLALPHPLPDGDSDKDRGPQADNCGREVAGPPRAAQETVERGSMKEGHDWCHQKNAKGEMASTQGCDREKAHQEQERKHDDG